MQEADDEVIAEPDESQILIKGNKFIATERTSITSFGLQFIQDNGWYMVLLCLVLYYIWSTKLSKIYEEWSRQREVHAEGARLHKNSDIYLVNEEARIAKINKLQEEYNQQAQDYAIKVQEKEQKKREEWLKKRTKPGEHVLGTSETKPDYSPLNGGGSLPPTYRPARRSTCPGGGCGGR